MMRLNELLADLPNMPGVTGAFLYGDDGVIATTMQGHHQQRIGRVCANLIRGAFSLGHFVHEMHCEFDVAVLLARPLCRGCVIVAVCEPGVSTRLVDISLTMTAKSIEDELSSLERLPPPLNDRGHNDFRAGAKDRAGGASSDPELPPGDRVRRAEGNDEESHGQRAGSEPAVTPDRALLAQATGKAGNRDHE